MDVDANKNHTNVNAIAAMAAIFSILFTCYLLTFNGRFTSIDELSLYAKAVNLVQQGSLDTPQLAFADQHNPVGEQESGYSLVVAPLYWLSQQFGHLNNIHVVMLLNPLLTAATGAVLFATARILGFSVAASSVTALAFGLGTLAWPYARTLYREPLVGLGWSLGLFGLILWRYRGRVVWGVMGSAVLMLTLAVKAAAIAGVPLIFLAIFARVRDAERRKRTAILLLAAILVSGVLFYIVFSWRYEVAWHTVLLARWSPRIGLERIYGQLLSPGKGVIFYAPAVILAVPGLITMAHRHGAVALASGLPILSIAVAYSGYNSWFGGQSWGPRFLLPALPLLMLNLAPIYDAARKRWQRPVVFAVLAVSTLIQMKVVTADWWPGYKPLFSTGPRPEANAGLRLANLTISPPLVQLRVWDPVHLDLLWLHPDLTGSISFSLPLALGLITSVVAVAILWWLVKQKRLPFATMFFAPLGAILVLLWWGPRATAGYPGLPADQARELANRVAGEDDSPYTLVTVSNEFHVNYYLGFLKGDFIHHWISPSQTEGFEPILSQTKGDRLVLVVDRVHIDPAYSGKELEWWLNEQLFRYGSQWIEGYELVDYAILPADDWSWQDSTYTFGESFSLPGYAISDQQLQPGQILGLQLRICRDRSLPDYHHLFTHLQGSEQQISGHDGPIRYGGTLIVPWETGDCLVERRAIPIPVDTGPGTYDVIAGFDTADGLLPVKGDQSATTDKGYVVLGQVTIEP